MSVTTPYCLTDPFHGCTVQVPGNWRELLGDEDQVMHPHRLAHPRGAAYAHHLHVLQAVDELRRG
jgi:hypothetical protein